MIKYHEYYHVNMTRIQFDDVWEEEIRKTKEIVMIRQ